MPEGSYKILMYAQSEKLGPREFSALLRGETETFAAWSGHWNARRLVSHLAILLVGFAPVAWIFSQSTDTLAWMGFLHLVFWFVATLFGVRFMKSGFSHTNAKSHAGLNVWIIIFLLVALQMTTALRPIIGKADTFFPTEKKFFLANWFDSLNGPGAEKKKAEDRP